MSHPDSRGDSALPRPCALGLQDESYESDRDKYTVRKCVFDGEILPGLTEGVWLTDASVIQDPDDWPAWTDLPLDCVLVLIGGRS